MLLKVSDLVLQYQVTRGIVHAVDNVSFQVDRGEAFGIVGESGCGKTSLALALLRLFPKNTSKYDGSIELEGSELMEIREDEFRRHYRWKKVSMVFQGAMNSLNPVMRVGRQVTEPLREEKVPKSEASERGREMLELVGLSREISDRYPHELSGGMKQRVVIAMALIQNPKIVILDEPTSALDVSIQAQIMNLLKSLKKEGIAMIFITHDIALASDLSDKLGVMYGGEMVEAGSLEQILVDPKHPYTQSLLASTPKLHGDKIPSFIPGAPPSLFTPPDECRFRSRCKFAFEMCVNKVPVLTVGNGHTARCFLYGDKRG